MKINSPETKVEIHGDVTVFVCTTDHIPVTVDDTVVSLLNPESNWTVSERDMARRKPDENGTEGEANDKGSSTGGDQGDGGTKG